MKLKLNLPLLGSFLFLATTAWPQTSSFTYQGRLTDAGIAASGVYDLTFRLFSDAGGTAQVGGDQVRNDVQVTAGVFTVTLDFGVSPFTSATGNYLQISVRPGASVGPYSPLNPLQPVTASPYSVSTIRAQSAANADNANQLGGLASTAYVKGDDGRLADARTPTPGSADYVQNRTTVQPSTNFNINGRGTLSGPLRADSLTVDGAPTGAGQVTALYVKSENGYGNGSDTILHANAGNTSVFVGKSAGNGSTLSFNTFVGYRAGFNSPGTTNSFFGSNTGEITTANENSFFGYESGVVNTSGMDNVFVGYRAGDANSTGLDNVFVGANAGFANSTGSNNTFVGNFTWGTDSLQNAAAIGANARVTQSNSLVLGSGASVGIGTSAPQQKLHVDGTSEILSTGTGGGFKFRDRGSTSTADDWVWYSNANIARFFRAGTGDLITIGTNGNVGIGVPSPAFPLEVRTAASDRAGFFHNLRTVGFNYGLYGVADGTGALQNIGVRGDASGATDFNMGAYMFATGNNAYGLYVGAGTKNWVNPHPADPTRSIVYVTLEGAESGAYWRGKGRTINGKATIVLPEHFQLATSPESDITVTVTPRSVRSKGLAVVSSSNHDFAVEELLNGRGNYEFDYIVIGIRRGYETWDPIKDMLDYVPFYGNRSQMDEARTSTQEFYDQQSEGLRRIFISNGLLNPDGSVNRYTFQEHGWRIVERRQE
jgi:hypothetical protein